MHEANLIQMLDHTADVGFEVVKAPTLEALFDESRQALLMTMLEEPPERSEGGRSVRLSAPDLETLLMRWINELVFFIQATVSSRSAHRHGSRRPIREASSSKRASQAPR